MNRRRLLPWALVWAALLPVLAGCVEVPMGDDGLSVDEAKLVALNVEDEIAALIPAENVAASEQRADGPLLSCDAERHQWSGRTTLKLQGDVDFDEWLTVIEEEFTPKGFSIQHDRTVLDYPRISLLAPDGSDYLVAPEAADTLVIDSFSPCFTLPEGVYPGGDF